MNYDLTVYEAYEKRLKLEAEIGEKITEFCRETGLKLEDITISYGDPSPKIDYKIDLKLSI